MTAPWCWQHIYFVIDRRETDFGVAGQISNIINYIENYLKSLFSTAEIVVLRF